MAISFFAVTYLFAGAVYGIVTKRAVGDRARF